MSYDLLAEAGGDGHECPGFQDTQSKYIADPRKLIGQIRRPGEAGPAYEIVAVEEPDKLVIEVTYSGEVVTLKLKHVVEDPMAETIP